MSDRPTADATRQIARPSQGGRVSPSLEHLPPAGMGDEQLVTDFADVWLPLPPGVTLMATTAVDPITTDAIAPFDYQWDGSTTFTVPGLPGQLPRDFGVGIIVGASGSGKSTLLRRFAEPSTPAWDERPIAAHFASAADAAERFYAVGLNTVPTWTKPYRVLSNGERFRADLARTIGDDAVIDEYTSVVDRNVALSTSNAIRRYVAQHGLRRIVIASCHRDILPWLAPDWVIDLDIRCWALRPRECLQRPDLVVAVYAGAAAAWEVFHRHHYLSADLNGASEVFVATMNDQLVAFSAVLSFPNGNLRHAFREHRTVVLPDFQGMGIGMRLSDWVGQLMIDRGRRYFSRTAHPRMGAYREASPLWRATTNNRVQAVALSDRASDDDAVRRGRTGWDAWDFDTTRLGWSHEYVGLTPVQHQSIDRTEPLTLGLTG